MFTSREEVRKSEEFYNKYRQVYWHTKPVLESLVILEEANLIEKIEGSSKKLGLVPFSAKLINGEYICKPNKLHEKADEVLLNNCRIKVLQNEEKFPPQVSKQED